MNKNTTFYDWLSEEASRQLTADIESWSMESYTPKTIPFKVDPDNGDAYWCPTHVRVCGCSREDRRWGRFGAAGVLFFHRATGTFLLNHRSGRINHGETWSTLGGAIDRNEDPFDGAMREVEEEIGTVPPPFWMIASHEAVTKGEHSNWTYTTFVVEVTEQWEPEGGDAWETMGNAWVSLSEMSRLPLHPSFRATVHTLIKKMYMQGAFR